MCVCVCVCMGYYVFKCVCVCVCVTISVCTCKYFCFFVYISACVCVCVYSIECLSYSSTYNMGRVCMLILIFSSTMMIYDEKVRKHACVVNFIYIRDGMENNRFLQKYSLIFCCF